MRSFYIFIVIIFLMGLYSISAQDLIVLRNGNIIEAKVIEISSTEIRYKRFDHLDGPIIVILKTDILSIRYEDSWTEIINTVPASEQQTTQAISSQNYIIDPKKFIFGINVNAGGAIGYAFSGGSGAGINIELGKGNFNSEINLMLPSSGFGLLFTFNYFSHSNIGGFYFGGGFGYIWLKDVLTVFDPRSPEIYQPDIFQYNSHIIIFGLNLGYKFVLSSGLYFRTGAYIGMGIDIPVLNWPNYGATVLNRSSGYSFYIKPDLAIGWTIK